MRPYRRADRVAVEIRAALTRIIQLELRDPRVGPLTITRVRLSADLRHAWVAFVPLGGEGDAAAMAEGLHAARGWLRRRLGREVRLKVLPELRFQVDEGLDRSVELARLLGELGRARAGGEE